MGKKIDYWVIESFMTKHLKLRGIKLDVFAIIYGFSKDMESTFNSAPRYIVDITGYSRPNVSNAINELEEEGLIVKEKFRDKFKYKVVDNIDEIIKTHQNSGVEEQSIVTDSYAPTEPIVTDSYEETSSIVTDGYAHINNTTNYDITDNNKIDIRTSDDTEVLPSEDLGKVKIEDSAEKLNEVLNNEDIFGEVFSQPVGTDKKSRLEQTINSEGTQAKELFDYWNSKHLRVHRQFQQHYIERFSKIIQKYTFDEIKKFIDNYTEVVKDTQFFWTHVWDLQDFIDPREERYLRFAEDGDVYQNYKAGSKSQQAFKNTAFHNEQYNEALNSGVDIGKLDDEIAEKQRKLRQSPNVIKL